MDEKQSSPVRVMLMGGGAKGASCAEVLPEWLEGVERSGKFRIFRVSSLPEAVQMLHGDSADVVLVDFDSPEGGGLDALRGLKRAAGHVPVVVLRSGKDEETDARVEEEGAWDILDKPGLTSRVLLRAVGNAAECARLREQSLVREREIQEAFDHTPVMMCLLDSERRIVRCNQPAALFTGRPVEELTGLRMGTALECENSGTSEGCGGANPACDRCEFRAVLDAVFRDDREISRSEVRLVMGGAWGLSPRSFLVSTGHMAVSGRGLVLLALEDITDCRVAEREALERLCFQQVVMDTIPLPIFHKNVRGEYLGCNRAFAEMAGRSKEDLIGLTVGELGLAEQVEIFTDTDDYLMAHRGQTVFDTRFEFADGILRDVRIHKVAITDAENRVTGLVGVVVDMTGQMRSEEERNRLATAVEHAAESIVITDPDGRIRYVNPAFEKLTGFTREEAQGHDFLLLGNGDHDERFYDAIRKSLSLAERWKGHLGSRTKDGRLREEEASISVVRNDLGTPLGFVCIKRDVTKEMSLERQLRQAQKLEAVGTLAGGIAHDFNNILGAMMGYTELALFDVAENEGVRTHLVEIMKGARRARELVKQILAFSRKGEQERQPVMVSPILKEALKLLRASLPSTIEIRDRISPCKRLVLGDPTQIHQILMNLCTNAAHAMRDHGGTLSVSLEEHHLDARDVEAFTKLDPGVYLRLTVTDTGIGMDAEIVERIFDPYFTTKPMGEGTGLGLAVVHGIVSAWGGAIGVVSEPDNGTSFQIMLPTMTDATQVAPGTETSVVVPRGNEHILMVDDEVALTEIGVQLLEHLGYRATARNGSAEALELFLKDPEAFDLLLTDQTMPQMTGDELIRRVRAVRPDFPVVLCTGFSEKITQDMLDELGVRYFLLKPIVYEQLAQAVRNALDERRGK